VAAQKGQPVLDTRIDNQRYWKKMAGLGLTRLNPVRPVPAAVPTGDGISAPAVALFNSADVLINYTPNATLSENSVAINPASKIKALNSNNSTMLTWVEDPPCCGEIEVPRLGAAANTARGGRYVNEPQGTSYYTTTNQGANWSGFYGGAGGINWGDPAAAISNNNRYYIGFISTTGGQGVAWSTNEGATWERAVVAEPENCTNPFLCVLDKNHLIVIARSTNGGLNWSPGINISANTAGGSHDQGVNLQTGPNGEVYAAWAIYDTWPADESAIGFARSTDGGATFQPSQRIINNIRGIRITEAGKNMRTNSFPVMAVDNSYGPNRGHIYVVWTNVGTPGTNTGNDVDIYMIKSTNGGTSWSTPALIHRKTAGQGKKHYLPWITCDPTTGKLHVVFYDDRNTGAAQCETWVSSSFDGGATWDDYKVSDVAFTPVPIPDLAFKYFGDYLGIAANDDVIYPVWTDNRNGVALAYTSPLISADQCATALSLQNITMPNGGTFKYRAATTISTAGGGSAYTMQSGARASMVAANSITLQPNTSIQNGAVLSIVPGACSSPLLRTGGQNGITQETAAEEAELGVVTKFMLYPNPAQQTVTLRMAGNIRPSAGMRYTITTLMGQLLLQERVTDQLQRINISSLKTGGYFLNIYDNGKLLETKKLVKQ
jgi:Secretion system C-terminal sorting domain